MDRVQRDILEIIEKKDLFDIFRSRKVLVTGATGLIGSMFIKALHVANERYDLSTEIIGQIRNKEKARDIFGALINAGDIRFVHESDIECDYILHAASPTASKFFINNPVETIKASVIGTMEILEAAKKSNAKVIYLSSMEEYGIPYIPGEIMTEDRVGIIDHLNVRSSYSESKRLCECMCVSYASEYKVDVCIARLAQTFGAGISKTDNRMPVQFTKAAVDKNDIILHTEGKSISNFVYLTDAINALCVLLNKGISGQAYNVCNDKETRSVYQIAELVAAEVAKGQIKVIIEKQENTGYAPDVNMLMNSNKLRSLGWKAKVDMKEAYRRLAKYIIESK